MRIKNYHVMVFFSICLVVFPTLVIAQSPPNFNDDVGDTTPIDGGLSLLVAAGVGYGAKKMKERKESRLNKN